MTKIPIPGLDTPITVLCDMTRTQELSVENVDAALRPRKSYSLVEIVRPSYGAAYIQHEIYRLLLEAYIGAKAGKRYVLILTNNLQVTALAAVIMNSLAEKHYAGVPVIDANMVRVWEVWDDTRILMTENDGRVTSTSFDEAFRPIVSDIMRMQRLNAPASAAPEDVEAPGTGEECPNPRILEKAVVDEGGVANSPQDIIRRRIDAIQTARNAESGVPEKQS